jgi:8-oxo-dGTP pyrophosphatase MutT (NUDIX family)
MYHYLCLEFLCEPLYNCEEENIMPRYRKAPRAGYLPYYVEDGKLYIMFMKPSDSAYGGDRFQIAKGKVDPGETAEVAAKREAHEELGLKTSNLDTDEHFGTFLGYTELYFGRVKDREDFDPFDYETGETKWIEVSEFCKIGRSLHIPIIKALAVEVAKFEPSLQTPQSEK